MTNRKIVLYVYDTDTREINTHFDMILERQIIDMESRNERERVYAVNLSAKRRYEISDKSDTVFYDHDSHTYRIWYDEPDIDRAIYAIGNYILNSIGSDILDIENLLTKKQEEELAAINLLEKLK